VSRVIRRVEILPVRPRYETLTNYKCDKCGKPISREDRTGDAYAHELVVLLDQEECVNFFRRRDLCPGCLKPTWLAVNELLGVSGEHADDERDKDYFDEDGTID
jgi:hypothetical protein